MKQTRHTPLVGGISQFDVDFVIPRVGVDLPLGIDPFLLFKSRDPVFVELHRNILLAFNAGIRSLAEGDLATAEYLFDFPEVPEIGFGYTEQGKRGSGVGDYLSQLIIETLKESPDLMERGVRHVEEMQLVSIGISVDRISDIVANIIKQFLIQYTQKHCSQLNIPLTSGVPVSHIFDPQKLEWFDSHEDLPLSPFDQSPIILVPRRIVRAFPWINYDDFFRMEFSAYLRAKRLKSTSRPKLSKEQVISVTRAEVARIDRFIDRKEATAELAQPGQSYILTEETCPQGEHLKRLLNTIETGANPAPLYQRTVLEILNYLFNPELIDGELEVKTIDGTERRDIIFTNDSDQSFWSYVRNEHSAFLLMFEIKNSNDLDADHFNQVATYLGDRLGRLGFIVTRNSPSDSNGRKAFSIYNDSSPRKIIIVLSDADLANMIDLKCRGENPMVYVQRMYRIFRQTIQ